MKVIPIINTNSSKNSNSNSNSKNSSTKNALAMMRIFQLASSNLPVGGYTFSQGLEYAIDAGWLRNAMHVREWIEQVAINTLTNSDLPLIGRQYRCIEQADWVSSSGWNDYALAIRETRELLLTDTAMGEAMLRLAKGMNIVIPEYCLPQGARISFTTAYSLVAASMGLSLHQASAAYSWTVIENQVLAATKLLPMGQTAAQNMLFELSATIERCADEALNIEDNAIGLSLPGLAMASIQHETQYSRLYRS